MGSTTAIATVGGTGHLQVLGTGGGDSLLTIGRFSANAGAPQINFAKSRNGTIGGNTIVQDGDSCGEINWCVSDGSDMISYIAQVEAEVDGTPGSNDTPGRLIFKTTADGASGVTEKMRITHDGKVGIGTNAPSKNFVVKGASGDQARFEHNGAVGAVDIYSGTDGGLINIRNASGTSVINLDARNSTNSYYNHTGNFGIGTASPSAKLDVRGNVSFFSSDASDYVSFTHSDNGIIINSAGSTSNKMTLNTGGTTALTIDASQNVGIGTVSPDAKLEITGGTATDLFSLEGAGSNFKLLAESGNSNSSNIMSYRISLDYASGTATNGFIDFYRGSDGANGFLTFGASGAEKMRIDGSGNVGIGTDSPQQKLQVDGNIYLGPNNTDNAIHSGASVALMADTAVKIVADANDTSGVGAAGADIIFGYGTSTNTDSNRDFTIAELGTHPRVEIMRIDASTDRVGIGTASPGRQLSLYGEAVIRLDGTGDSGLDFNTSGTSDMQIRYRAASDKLQVYSYGTTTNVMTIKKADGNVGIGEVAPATKLHISSGSAQTDSDGMLKVEQTSTSSGSAATNAGINTKNYHGTSQFLQWEEHGLRIGSRILTNSGTGDVIFTAGADSEKMRIKADGKIGIGTESPNANLSLGAVTGAKRFLVYDGGSGNNLYAGFGIDAPASNDFSMYAHNNGVLKFGKMGTDASTITPYMTITNAGLVGIGTTSPSYKLEVNQDANVGALKVTGGGGGTPMGRFVRDVGGSSYVDIHCGGDDPQITFTTASAARQWSIGADSGAHKFFISENSAIGTNDRFCIDDSGLVGIGTTSPAEKLHVVGNVRVHDTGYLAAGDGNDIFLRHDGNGHLQSGAGQMYINNAANTNMILSTNNTTALTISNSQHLTMGDGKELKLGGDDGLRIQGGNGNAFIDNYTGALFVRMQGDNTNFLIQADNGSGGLETYFEIDGANHNARFSKKLGIGATNPVEMLCVRSTSTYATSIEYDASTRLRIGVAGSGVATFTTDNNAACAFTKDVVAYATSDKRLKDNIKPLDNALDKISKISGVEFDWNDTRDEDGKPLHSYKGHDVGVIAQEIEEVLPEVVTTRDNGYKAVKYEKIVPLLIEAIKEQQKQIEELKNG